MANHVPTGTITTLGKEGVAAGYVFFGMDHIQFVGGFAPLAGNRQEADTVNGTDGRPVFREMKAKFEPREVGKIDKKKKGQKKKRQATPGDRGSSRRR